MAQPTEDNNRTVRRNYLELCLLQYADVGIIGISPGDARS
jgi:hypothetical protein